MSEDAEQEHAAPRYRDPERAERIVTARRRDDRVKDIAAREGASRRHVWRVCRDAAMRDEEGMADVRETVEHEGRVCALLDALPKDRTISRDEAQGFPVELYRTGMKHAHRKADELRSGICAGGGAPPRAGVGSTIRGRAGNKTPPLGPLLDFRELRKAW